MDTRTLTTNQAEITYDVHGPLPTSDGRPVLLLVAQPMDASGFYALASHLGDRTVVTYDPRGLGRSTRSDGLVTQSPGTQAEDLHALIEALGTGPVELLASSGGAVTALALVTAYPQDVSLLVAHEPPLTHTLPDAEAVDRALAQVQETYQAKGWGHGMAAFVGLTSWPGEITDDYFATPTLDPAQFGMPTDDDGSRDDPLLSGRGNAMTGYHPDIAALRAAPTRIIVGVGEETGDTFTGRTARALAQALDREPVVFPGGHGGFSSEEGPWPGQATSFAVRLVEVLG